MTAGIRQVQGHPGGGGGGACSDGPRVAVDIFTLRVQGQGSPVTRRVCGCLCSCACACACVFVHVGACMHVQIEYRSPVLPGYTDKFQFFGGQQCHCTDMKCVYFPAHPQPRLRTSPASEKAPPPCPYLSKPFQSSPVQSSPISGITACSECCRNMNHSNKKVSFLWEQPRPPTLSRPIGGQGITAHSINPPDNCGTLANVVGAGGGN